MTALSALHRPFNPAIAQPRCDFYVSQSSTATTMAHQSPMISIPKKGTDEVDWTTPIRNLIAQSFGESPDNYAAECAALQRCRQDAVRGAGSETTGALRFSTKYHPP